MVPIGVRVMVLETWDEVVLNGVPSGALVSDLKARALTEARVVGPPADYLVKFRGAEVPEGATTVADAGLVPNAGLIVLRRRRVPAK